MNVEVDDSHRACTNKYLEVMPIILFMMFLFTPNVFEY